MQLYDEHGYKIEKVEERKTLKSVWSKIFRKHENNIHEEWNEEKKERYRQDLMKDQRIPKSRYRGWISF